MLFTTEKIYSGKLIKLGHSVNIEYKNARQYSHIVIGQHVLDDVVVPNEFSKLMRLNEEIELTFHHTSAKSFLVMVLCGFLVLIGTLLDIDALYLGGFLAFLASLIYWVASLMFSSHAIYSIKVNNKLYRDQSYSHDYEFSSVSGSPVEQSVSIVPVQSEPAAHDFAGLPESVKPAVAAKTEITIDTLSNIPISTLNDSHEQNHVYPDRGAEPGARNGKRTRATDLIPNFKAGVAGVTLLSCPKCAADALVESTTNLICGDCKVWMKADTERYA